MKLTVVVFFAFVLFELAGVAVWLCETVPVGLIGCLGGAFGNGLAGVWF